MVSEKDMKEFIKHHRKSEINLARSAYRKYHYQVHDVKTEYILCIKRVEYIYYFLLWRDIVSLFSQLNEEREKIRERRKTKHSIHITNNGVRFI